MVATGSDNMRGGTGNDTYIVNSNGDRVIELAGQGTDLVRTNMGFTMGSNIERLTLTGSLNISGFGNTLGNLVTGNAGRNLLTGRGGNDTILGAAGIDHLFGDDGNDILRGGVGNDTVRGGSGVDQLFGDGGNDLLDGSLGADTMRGGLGDDTYIVDAAGDRAIELAGQGTDQVTAGVSFTLGSDVENLTLVGLAALNGTGNTLANIITGNGGNNILDGREGNDSLLGGDGTDTLNGGSGDDLLRAGPGNDGVLGGDGNDQLFGDDGDDTIDGGVGVDNMRGGAGNDTYAVNVAGEGITELAGEGTDLVLAEVSFSLGDNLENLTLLGVASINGAGNTLANIITGNSGNNTLDGGEGNDSLFGGAGTDVLNGGNGDDLLRPGPGNGEPDTINGGDGFDTVDYSDALAGVDVTVRSGVTFQAAIGDVLTSVEQVIGSRFDDRLIPSDLAFALATGGPGNDVIHSSLGTYNRIRGDDGFDQLDANTGSTDDIWLQYDRGLDLVTEFRVGPPSVIEDHIVVDSDEFNLTTGFGFINPSEFEVTVSSDYEPSSPLIRLFYNQTTRLLFADKDGSGTAFSAVPIAAFTNSADPAASNIFVF